jgi:uncharacterized protein (DUF952 family)
MILHITTRADWDAARATGSYRPVSLEREGFIHCSTSAQAVDSANKYFHGRADLILLCIDESRVEGELRYEPPATVGGVADPRAGELFPHIYGPLDPDVVVRTVAFPCDRDGRFALPPDAGG